MVVQFGESREVNVEFVVCKNDGHESSPLLGLDSKNLKVIPFQFSEFHGEVDNGCTHDSARVEAARAGASASDSNLPLVSEFENPQHEALWTRTIYNSCTALMKAQSSARQTDGFKALRAACDWRCRRSCPT